VVENKTIEIPIELISQLLLGIMKRHILEHDAEISSRKVCLIYDPLIFLAYALNDENGDPPYHNDYNQYKARNRKDKLEG